MPDDTTPATKKDLDALEASMLHMEERLTERMRDMQTEVLRAFHNWAKPVDIKLRSHEERLALLEERVTGIERGELPPRPRQ